MIKQSRNHKGAVAEAKIAAAAIELGVSVLKPMSEHGRYDLVFDLGERLVRVQCKWGNQKREVVAASLGGNYLTPNGYVRSTYSSEEVDAIAIYCGALDECFLPPIEMVAGIVWCICVSRRPETASERDYTLLPTTGCLGL